MSKTEFDSNDIVHRSRRAKKHQLEASEQIGATDTSGGAYSKKNNRDGKPGKKKKAVWKTVLKFFIFSGLLVTLIGMGYVAAVISKAPKIETDNIENLLAQSSILYDQNGEIIDNVFSESNRTLVEIGKIPLHTQKAFIALEDKTFESHHGFNIIRIFGAIRDAIRSNGNISGTSTITQQLARNLYMSDRMQERSLNRKIIEAYYSVILENNLTKDQILEAYLNTVYFGSSAYGIQTASQAYFSKDVSELTIAESAVLASIPQRPTYFALVQKVPLEQVTENSENLILKTEDSAYVWNDKCHDRMLTCLKLMHEQGYITDEEYAEAKTVEIKDVVNPTVDALDTVSNYFADYVLTQVIADFQEQFGWSREKAADMVYNRGVRIYTTMDSQAQSVIEKEYNNDNNFPQPTGYRKDAYGNILDSKTGKVLLYAYSRYVEKDGTFKLKSSEFKKNADGSLTIYAGKRLAIYNTTVQGKTDYSVEFKSMYTIDNGKLYSIPGGFINIPQPYKSRDSKDNLVISAKFFEDYPNFFKEEGKQLSTNDFSLKQRVIQPQSAMTIVDNKTGAIKAMIGGRKITGRMLFNRAIGNRQPGSSIKPIAVYAAALQKSYELSQAGKVFPFVKTGYDRQGISLWGDYITAGSIVEDEPLTVNGRIWPKNSYRGYRGLYTFRTALQQSVNVCAVKILAQVGVDYSYSITEKFGITSLVKDSGTNDLNLAALGMGGMTKGVSTLEMAAAYSTFVNNGSLKTSHCYTKVTNRNGEVILEPKLKDKEVLNPGVAWIMRDVLQSVVSEGIGFYARVPGAKVGGKTGTTSDSFDIWFDGFTANYSASIWIGNDVNIKLSSMSPAAARLWGKIMAQCKGALGGSYSAKPSNVVSASIATGKGNRTEFFTKGTQPKGNQAVYQTVQICTESGMLATPSCPHTESKTGIVRPYEANQSVGDYNSGLPHFYCHLHNPDPMEYPPDPSKHVTIVPVPIDNPDPDDPDNPDDDPSDDPPDGGDDEVNTDEPTTPKHH